MQRGTSAGTIRLLALMASAFALMSHAAAASAQTPTFSASPVIFAPTGTNVAQTQTVDITVNTATAISNISIPLTFNGSPEFMLVDQGGCKFDGTTINAASTVCHMLVRFRPALAGRRNASLMITDGSGNKTAIPMSGVGFYPQIAITPAATRIVTGLGPNGLAYSGDGGAAQLAGLSNPQGIAADSFGNIYFADTNNNVVRMLDAFGNITTVAGGGLTTGAAADGGLATNASLVHPTWLAVDAAGNLYMSESGNNVVRRVAMSTSRIITTVAGSYSIGNSNGTSAITGKLYNPQGIAVDPAGNLFIVDGGNQVIRRVDAVSGLMSTFAGNGASSFNASSTPALEASFYFPEGIAIDTAGNIFVTDTANHAVREISNGNVTVAAGTGVSGTPSDGTIATNAALGSPAGIAISPSGDVYFVDTLLGIVCKVQSSDGAIETIAGTAKDAGSFTSGVLPSTSVRMSLPMGLTFDSSLNLYFTDTGNNVIRELSSAPGELAYAAQAVGNTSSALKLKIANIGNISLGLAGVTAANSTTSSNFTFANSTTEPCGSSVGSGAHCAYNVSFAPQTSGFLAGQLNVTHVSNNPNFNTAEPVYLSAGVMPTLSIGPDTLGAVIATQALSFPISATGGFGAIATSIEGTLPTGVTTAFSGATITLSGTPTQSGTFGFTVFASDALGDTATKAYTLSVLPALITTTITENLHANDDVSELPGLQITVTENMHVADSPALYPALNVTVIETIHVNDGPIAIPPVVLKVAELIHVSDGLSELPSVFLPVHEVITVTDALNDQPGKSLAVTETIHVTDAFSPTISKPTQTLTVANVPAHTYGDAAFAVSATSSAGLTVAISVKSGPAAIMANKVDLTGAGTVTLLFSQPGDANTAAAPSVERTFLVTPAMASITATSTSRSFETANPTFAFSIGGLVHGDTSSALGGSPSITTNAVLNSRATTYPVTVSQGTISTPNYTFTFVPGTLTIIGHVSQSITFFVIPNLPSTVTTLSLSAHSTSGLPITYVVTGPASVTKNQLHITGTGGVSVTATQSGDATFDPANSITRTFTVTP